MRIKMGAHPLASKFQADYIFKTSICMYDIIGFHSKC